MSGDGGGGDGGVGEEGVSAASQAEAAGTIGSATDIGDPSLDVQAVAQAGVVGQVATPGTLSGVTQAFRQNLAVFEDPISQAIASVVPGASLAQLGVSAAAAVASNFGFAGPSGPATGSGDPGEPGGGGAVPSPAPLTGAAPTTVAPAAVSGVDLVARDNKLAEEARQRDIAAKAAETKAKARASRETEPLRLLANRTAQTRISTTPLGLTGTPANLRQPTLLLGG